MRTGDELGFHIPGPYSREAMAFFSVQPRRLGGEIRAEGAFVLFGHTLFEICEDSGRILSTFFG